MKKKVGAGSAEAAKRVRRALTSRGRGRLQVLERALADGTAINPQLLGAYVDALQDRYGELVRLVATRILPGFGPAAAKKLRPRLNLKGKASDGWVLVAVALTDRKKGIQTCHRALQNGSPAIQQAALLALCDLSPDEARAGAEAILQGRVGGALRRAALITLLKVGPSPHIIPQLVRWLTGPDIVLQGLAEAILKLGGRAAAAELAPVLADPDPEVRCRAAWVLQGIGPEAALAVPGLSALLRDPDCSSSCSAANCLGAIGPGARKAVGELEARLHSADLPLKMSIVYALFKITGNARPALEVFEPALESEDCSVYRDAALCLTEMGPAALPAAPAFFRILQDHGHRWRHFAADAVAAMKYDPAKVVPLLIGMLGDDVPYYERQSAIKALGRYGSAARDALPLLEDLRRRKRGKYIREALDPAIAAIQGDSGAVG